MSHETVYRATEDVALQQRVVSAGQKEARNNAELAATGFGQQLRDIPTAALDAFMFPVAIDYEDEYAYAIDGGNPDPGGDEAVITDANISAAVQAHWPADE